MNKKVKAFMKETGYTNSVSELFGVRKNYQRRNDWTFKKPEEMLADFLKWLNKKNS